MSLWGGGIAAALTTVALIYILAPTSGSHFNPLISWSLVLTQNTVTKHRMGCLIIYPLSQLFGACLGCAFVSVLSKNNDKLHQLIDIKEKPFVSLRVIIPESLAVFFLLTAVLNTACKGKVNQYYAMVIGTSQLAIAGTRWVSGDEDEIVRQSCALNPSIGLARLFFGNFQGANLACQQFLGQFIGLLLASGFHFLTRPLHYQFYGVSMSKLTPQQGKANGLVATGRMHG